MEEKNMKKKFDIGTMILMLTYICIETETAMDLERPGRFFLMGPDNGKIHHHVH
jgi:hypothetical protein